MVSGTVNTVLSRDYQGKTFWSLGLAGQDGLHGFGMYKPKVNKGDKVEFESVKNAKGYWQADKDTLKVTAGNEEVSSGGSSVAVAKAAAPGGYWDRKESRDLQNDAHRELGATRNTAIEWIKFLMANEALPKLPAVAKREDYFNALLQDNVDVFMGKEPAEKPAKPSKAAKEAAVEKEETNEDKWN